MDADEIIAAARQGEDAEGLPIGGATGGETLRERYRRCMFFQRVDRIPNFEFGYWKETLKKWHAQGLPPEVVDERSAYAYFGIEDWRTAPVDVMGLRPGFEYRVLEDADGLVTYRGADGAVAQINKEGNQSIPHFLEFPVKDRRSWEEEIKPRLRPGGERVPDNWTDLAAAYRWRDYPLAVPRGSLIGRPRDLIGFENIALMVYDDPDLLEEIVETYCQLVIGTLERLLVDVEFDFAAGWEDICFNSGPIVGVEVMRDVVAPRYRRISDLLERHGCVLSWTDCDGDITSVVPAFLAGGINTMFPVEVHAGSDPVALRRRFPGLRFQGGVDKMILLEGREGVRREMERLAPVVREGGFIPGVDHRVQADADFDTYRYYLKLKRDLLGAGGEPQYDESEL